MSGSTADTCSCVFLRNPWKMFAYFLIEGGHGSCVGLVLLSRRAGVFNALASEIPILGHLFIDGPEL